MRRDYPVLSIRNLSVEIPTRAGVVKPVDGVSDDIAKGEILGVVGESGARKSMAGNAVIGLLNPPAHISAGEIWLNGKRIDPLQGEAMRRLRGKEISMIFQDPLTSLNPLLTIGDQLAETMLTHLPISQKEAEKRAVAALEEVGVPGAAERIDSYPHEFSGGTRQGFASCALASRPRRIVCDEPTTALDVSVQAQVLNLMSDLDRRAVPGATGRRGRAGRSVRDAQAPLYANASGCRAAHERVPPRGGPAEGRDPGPDQPAVRRWLPVTWPSEADCLPACDFQTLLQHFAVSIGRERCVLLVEGVPSYSDRGRS